MCLLRYAYGKPNRGHCWASTRNSIILMNLTSIKSRGAKPSNFKPGQQPITESIALTGTLLVDIQYKKSILCLFKRRYEEIDTLYLKYISLTKLL